MKHGFTLIEFIIATLIASMIGSILLTALYQSGRFQKSVDTMFDDSLRVAIVVNQLEKDLMGAFIPTQARIKEDKDEEEEESPDKEGGKKSDKKDDTKKVDQQEGKKEGASKPAEKPLEKIFVSSNKGNNLNSLTFITNNPMVVFVGKDVGTVKPKIVRVQYVLKPEEEKGASGSSAKKEKDTFTLFRQESMELDLAKFGNTRSYELISGIKEFSVTYTAKIEKKPAGNASEKASSSAKAMADKSLDKQDKTSDKRAPEPAPKKEYEYKTSKDWVSERQKEEQKKEEQQEQEYPRIPYLVECKMSLWNPQHTKAEEFTLSFELPVDTSQVQKKEEKKEKKPEPKKNKSDDKSSKDSSIDKNKQAHNDKTELIETLTVTLGNLTKVFNKNA